MIAENEKIENLLKTGIKTISMNRINYAGRRMYISSNPFQVYSGLTGALSAVTFKGHMEEKRLVKWRDIMVDALGREGQKQYLRSMADFGTLVHEIIVRIWEKKTLDWKYEKDYAWEYFMCSDKTLGIEPNENVVRQRVFEYCKNASALMQFVYDHVEEILAVESMAKSDDLLIATPIDITCKIKGKIVTLNIKTSSQISDHHREQVSVEKFLWNNTYPDNQAEYTGIIRPKDWNIAKIPTYQLEVLKPDQEHIFLSSAIGRFKIALADPNSTYADFPNSYPQFKGHTKLGESPVIELKSLEELFTQSNN